MYFRYLQKLSVVNNIKTLPVQVLRILNAKRAQHSGELTVDKSCAPNCSQPKAPAGPQSSGPSFCIKKVSYSSYISRQHQHGIRTPCYGTRNIWRTMRSCRGNVRNIRISKIKSEKSFGRNETASCESPRENKTRINNNHTDELTLKKVLSTYLRSTRKRTNFPSYYGGSGAYQIAYRTPMTYRPHKPVAAVKTKTANNQQRRFYSSKDNFIKKPPETSKTTTSDDLEGLPYFFRRVIVEGDNKKSTKYEVQKVFFKYPNKIINHTSTNPTNPTTPTTPTTKEINRGKEEKQDAEEEVEYLKEVITKTVEKISENEYKKALEQSSKKQVEEVHYNKVLKKKSSPYQVVSTPSLRQTSSSKDKIDLMIRHNRKISTKSGENVYKEVKTNTEVPDKKLDEKHKVDAKKQTKDVKAYEVYVENMKNISNMLEEKFKNELNKFDKNLEKKLTDSKAKEDLMKPARSQKTTALPKMKNLPWVMTQDDFVKKVIPTKKYFWKDSPDEQNDWEREKYLHNYEINDPKFKERLKMFEGSSAQKEFEEAYTKTFKSSSNLSYGQPNKIFQKETNTNPTFLNPITTEHEKPTTTTTTTTKVEEPYKKVLTASSNSTKNHNNPSKPNNNSSNSNPPSSNPPNSSNSNPPPNKPSKLKDNSLGTLHFKLNSSDVGNQQIEPIIYEKIKGDFIKFKAESDENLSLNKKEKSRGTLCIKVKQQESRKDINFSKYLEHSQTLFENNDFLNKFEEKKEKKRLTILDVIWDDMKTSQNQKVAQIHEKRNVIDTKNQSLTSIENLKLKAVKQLEKNAKSMPDLSMNKNLINPEINVEDPASKILVNMISQTQTHKKSSARPELTNNLVIHPKEVHSASKLQISKVHKSASLSKADDKCKESDKKEDKDPFGRCKPNPYKHKQTKPCTGKLQKLDLRCNMKATCKNKKDEITDLCDIINYEPKRDSADKPCKPIKLDKLCPKKSSSSCKKDPCKKKEDPCKKKEDLCKKKEDPCKKKEDPCKKKEDPCKKKEDPCKKKEDPCKKKEDPCKKKEDPCKKKEDPCKKREDPCKQREDPCKKKEDPCKQKEDPCKKREDPCKKKKDPCKKKEDPCKKREDPCKKKEDPCKKKVDPCKMKEDPCESEKKDPCKSLPTFTAIKKGVRDACSKKTKKSVCPTTKQKKKDKCKKREDPCKKKKDPCKKKEDPCKKQRFDPCSQISKGSTCKKKKKNVCSPKKSIDVCKPRKKQDTCMPKKKTDPCKKLRKICKQKKKKVDPCKKKSSCNTLGKKRITIDDPCKIPPNKQKNKKASVCKPPKFKKKPKKKTVECKSTKAKKETKKKEAKKDGKYTSKGPQCKKEADKKEKKVSSKVEVKAKSKDHPKSNLKSPKCSKDAPDKKGASTDKKSFSSDCKSVDSKSSSKCASLKDSLTSLFRAKYSTLNKDQESTTSLNSLRKTSSSSSINKTVSCPSNLNVENMECAVRRKTYPSKCKKNKKKKSSTSLPDMCSRKEKSKGKSSACKSIYTKKEKNSSTSLCTPKKLPKSQKSKTKVSCSRKKSSDSLCKPKKAKSKTFKCPSKKSSSVCVGSSKKGSSTSLCKTKKTNKVTCSSKNKSSKFLSKIKKFQHPTKKSSCTIQSDSPSSCRTRKTKKSLRCIIKDKKPNTLSGYKPKNKSGKKNKSDSCKSSSSICDTLKNRSKGPSRKSSTATLCKLFVSKDKASRRSQSSCNKTKKTSSACVSVYKKKPPPKPKDKAKGKAKAKVQDKKWETKTRPCSDLEEDAAPSICEPPENACPPPEDLCKKIKTDAKDKKADPCKEEAVSAKKADPCKEEALPANCTEIIIKRKINLEENKCIKKTEGKKAKKSQLKAPKCSKTDPKPSASQTKKADGKKSFQKLPSYTNSPVKTESKIINKSYKLGSRTNAPMTRKSSCHAIKNYKISITRSHFAIRDPISKTSISECKSSHSVKLSTTPNRGTPIDYCGSSISLNISKKKSQLAVDKFKQSDYKSRFNDCAFQLSKKRSGSKDSRFKYSEYQDSNEENPLVPPSLVKCRSDPNMYRRVDVCKHPPFKPPKLYRVASYKFKILGPSYTKDVFDKIGRKKTKYSSNEAPVRKIVCNDRASCIKSGSSKIDPETQNRIVESIEERKIIAEDAMKSIPVIPDRLEEQYFKIIRRPHTNSTSNKKKCSSK